MTTSNDIILGYSPGDFFYAKADKDGVMPTKDQCTELNPYDETWDVSCNIKNFANNADTCYRKELCKNKEKVQLLMNNQNINSGSTQKYLDMDNDYNYQLLVSVNLGIGLLLLSGFIIKNTYYNI
jgi:hypothetical protein